MAKGKTAVAEPESDVKRVPCEFTGLSTGKEIFSLGIRMGRKKFSLKDADRLLCGSRLKVRVVKDGNVDLDTTNQQTFGAPEPEDVIESTVDVKGYTVKQKHISARLSFNASEIDKSKMLEFIEEKGYVDLERVGDIEERKAGRPKKSEIEDAKQQKFEGGEEEE